MGKSIANDRSLARPHVGAIDLTSDSQVCKEPCVRLYRSCPDAVSLQIRSVGSTTQRRGGVPKHIVSTAEMDRQSAKQLIIWLQRFVDGKEF